MKKSKSPGDGVFSTRGCPLSIVCAEAFHFRVRDENGWYHFAQNTRRLISMLSAVLKTTFVIIAYFPDNANIIYSYPVKILMPAPRGEFTPVSKIHCNDGHNIKKNND